MHAGVILSNNGFWCDTPWIPSGQCPVIFMFTHTTTSGGKLELTLCAKCLNNIKCTCRLLKANQASSKYEHERINFVNPQDYPEKNPIKKLALSKDFPRKTHRLGITCVKVTKHVHHLIVQGNVKHGNVKGYNTSNEKDLSGLTEELSDSGTVSSQVVQHSGGLRSSVTKKMVNDANSLSSEIERIKSNPNSVDSKFLTKEVDNVKYITLELHQYWCDLEKIIKGKRSLENVNSAPTNHM